MWRGLNWRTLQLAEVGLRRSTKNPTRLRKLKHAPHGTEFRGRAECS